MIPKDELEKAARRFAEAEERKSNYGCFAIVVIIVIILLSSI